MKKITWLLAVAAPMYLVSCQKELRTNDPTVVSMANAETGNGAPSGFHYNLNIIGVPKDKTADMTDNNGGRIFVNLSGHTKIGLTPAPEGESFQVLDANGTDANGATFQLPEDVATTWLVYARVPGNQQGSVTITTCAESAWDGTEIDVSLCSSITLDRLNYGKFRNVSADLLYVTLSDDIVDGSGNVVVGAGSYPLFDPALEGYFWDYDNNGLKLLQLRFYPIP